MKVVDDNGPCGFSVFCFSLSIAGSVLAGMSLGLGIGVSGKIGGVVEHSEAISHGYAIFHPETGEFVWVDDYRKSIYMERLDVMSSESEEMR